LTIALLHAYRTANRGDGWLVELSCQLVREATGIEATVYALDPAGMGPNARAVLPAPVKVRAGLSALATASPVLAGLGRRVVELPHGDDLQAAIGIGGGYLRTMDPVHELIFRAHHLPQVRLVASLGAAGAYLPVSVGPFRAGLGRSVRRALASTAWVATRDDRSTRYLAGWASTRRTPDLAACRLGVERPARRAGDPGVVGIVLRSLRQSDLGFAAVSILERRGMKPRYGVQASSGRTNDDRRHYASHGVADLAEDFGALLASDPAPAVILAGRLHAALDAIAAGFPTIHIGYERKSLGAFSDLGLADYVVDAWTGRPETLADQALALAADPEPYWARLETRFDTLAAAWRQLGEQVADVCSVR
jgi:polysaccharide pyruvyl transferase WcaK-like protein